MTQTTLSEGDAVENRSEIVFITDAQDCNPNGNPKGDNRPRIDPVTQQCVVTDVRLKRYLREQLVDDDHGVFVKTPGDEAESRMQLALDLLDDIDSEDDLEMVDDIREKFLTEATDVRYFGATLSFNKDPEKSLHERIIERFEGSNFTGPVQFSPARSLNAVETNDEYDTLTSVIATQEDKTTGGFGLDDHRIKYGVFPFHGIVDENGADGTGLTAEDVKRLDTLCWRALKNQTISRSKLGQEPRLYVRIEYETDSFHIGDLHHGVERDTDYSKPDPELRTVNDIALNVSGFVSALSERAEHIETIHIVGSDRLTITDGETKLGTAADIGSILTNEVETNVHRIDIYDEFEETLP